MWEPSRFFNLKFLRTETCNYEKKLITAQHPTLVYTCHIPAKDQPWTLNQDQAGVILFLKDLIPVPADMFKSHICPTMLHTTLISWIHEYSFNTWTSKSHSSVSLCIGEGPEYRPFRDFRPVPRAHISIHRRACTPMRRRAGIFSLFRNSDRLAGTFRWSEDPTRLIPSTTEDPACWKQVSSGR
jgi:hypothetical protein